jgi:voltage-gated potassium channel
MILKTLNKSKMKRKIYELVEKGSFGKKYNLYFDYFIASLIVLNVIAIAIESLPSLNETHLKFLRVFEVVSLLIFSVEFLMRLYVADLVFPRKTKLSSILSFVFSPLGLVDLFAILPFYIPFIIPIDLRFLRLFRLFRFIRVFKITRYNKAMNLIVAVFKEKKGELGTTFFVAFIILVIASFLMYFIEGKVQPEVFKSVFSSFWWALSTLTTVGYGDIYPVTVMGKVISALVSILGIGIVALPTGIISSGFVSKLNQSKSTNVVCPHCKKEFEHNFN